MRHRTAFVALAVALSLPCCGTPAAPGQDEAAPAPEALMEAPEPEGCGMVFSPVPELLEATEVAAARWSATTGCDVRTGEGGMPVLQTGEILDPGGVARDGWTGVVNAYSPPSPELVEHRGSMVVLLTGRRMPLAALHEMGHALGPDGHSDGPGVLGGIRPSAIIMAPDLELVCAHLPCSTFLPEAAIPPAIEAQEN